MGWPPSTSPTSRWARVSQFSIGCRYDDQAWSELDDVYRHPDRPPLERPISTTDKDLKQSCCAFEPQQGSPSESKGQWCSPADYRKRSDSGRTSPSPTPPTTSKFFFLRPKDIAIYAGRGTLGPRYHRSRPRRRLRCSRRRAAGDGLQVVDVPLRSALDRVDRRDLAGKRIATSYPNLVRADLGSGALRPRLSASTAPSKSRSSWVSQMRSPTWSDRVARCANTRWWLSAIPWCDSRVLVSARAPSWTRPRANSSPVSRASCSVSSA